MILILAVQKHLRWTMEGPHSSYSCLEIHICWKVEREARMEPPIQTEYFLSGGAMILILMVEGARAVISFCIRSAIPGHMVVAPDMTVLTSGRTCTPTPSCLVAPPCTLVLLTVCRRRSPPLLPPPSRSLLPLRGSTLSGSEDPSCLPCPPSSRCGSPSRSTTSAAHPLSTGSASKKLRSEFIILSIALLFDDTHCICDKMLLNIHSSSFTFVNCNLKKKK